ncbi:MAG: CBS domain-containing protein [Spirochaetia bacterium]|nr:CBS domain-containing protein [Spirochaetia bacterium]
MTELKDRLLDRSTKLLEASVEELMTTQVSTCDVNDLAAKPARMILENGFLGVLVIKDGHPVTMVTTFDLLKLAYEEGFGLNKDYMNMTVGELIKDKPLVSVPPGTKLHSLLNLMVERNVRTVPVIDADGVLHGIVSMTDMSRWYRDTHEEVRTGRF